MPDDLNLQEIPRYGNAGVAFLGVEVKDTYFLLVCVFIGIIGGARWGAPVYIGVPAAGYFLTKIYLDWTSDNLPGSFSALLYRLGLYGYSHGLRAKNVIYHGDAVAMNPGFDEQEMEMLTPYLDKTEHGSR